MSYGFEEKLKRVLSIAAWNLARGNQRLMRSRAAAADAVVRRADLAQRLGPEDRPGC